MTLTKSYKSRFVASVISVMLFVAVTEAVLRLFEVDLYFQNRFFVLNRALDYPDVFMRDHELFWRLRPDQTVTSKFFEDRTYSINSHGLRGREFSENKNRPRIIALGNSCTFGWGVGLDSTFTVKLQELLDNKYEVINAGIPGYTSFQGRQFLERELLKFKPDYLLILFGWNDHWAAANEIPDREQQFPPAWIISIQNNLSRLHSYRLLKKWLLSSIEQNPDSLFSRTTPAYRVDTTDFEHNLIDICNISRNNDAIPILMTAPIPSLKTYYPPGARSTLHSFHEKYNQIIRSLSVKENVLLVDVAREFDKYSQLYDDAKIDPIHFNEQGHDLTARLIAKEIAPVQ